MTTKLHIDMSHGVISIEGDPDLVRELYKDFKDHLVTGMPRLNPQDQAQTSSEISTSRAEPEKKPKAKARASSKKKNDAVGSGSGANPSAPKLDKQVDTSLLPAFYGQYEPKNNSEKILIFSKYLVDKGIEEPNTDRIYTLFKKTGERIPKAFAQAFHDAGSKHGFIDFNGQGGTVKVTIAGENHFNYDLKKKGAE